MCLQPQSNCRVSLLHKTVNNRNHDCKLLFNLEDLQVKGMEMSLTLKVSRQYPGTLVAFRGDMLLIGNRSPVVFSFFLFSC